MFLHCFLELSSCTIIGAGEIDAMLWCVCTAVAVSNDLGSTLSLRAHWRIFLSTHRADPLTLETYLDAAANRMNFLVGENEFSSNRR